MLCSALLTGAEAAYFSLGRSRLKQLAEEQGQTPVRWPRCSREPHELLVTLLVGITLINIGASALAAAIAERLLRPAWACPSPSWPWSSCCPCSARCCPMTLAVEHPERFPPG